MSAFLGPIHYWLYNKIQLQEDLTTAILEKDRDLSARLDSLCGRVERRPLEEVIDSSNIHGWLQEQIMIAEHRFATAVTTLLANGTTDLEALKSIAKAFGSTKPIQAEVAPDAFKALQDMLLDGMPCDHVNQILTQDTEKIEWKQTTDLHSPHWEKIGGDSSNYYALRAAFVSGILKESGFVFAQDGANCLLYRA